MSKLMTVDILSSIKGAKESEAVSQLFNVIKDASTNSTTTFTSRNNVVSLDSLREDVVIESSLKEKEIIIENFPKKKDRYLVVDRVIEE